MKVAIIGTGAMGSVYAALLADAGNEVWAIDSWQEHVEAINQDGLRLEGFSGDRTVKTIQASANASDAGICDLVIIATKAAQVEQAAQSIGDIVDDDTMVLAIQNGLGSGARIAHHVAHKHILLGVAQAFGASIRGPGHAHHNGMDLMRIGEMNGGMTDRLSSVVDMWRGAGFNAEGYKDISRVIWEKFVCNVTLSAPCTVFNRTVIEMMNDPDAWQISLNCAKEAYAAGKAKGVAFSFDDPAAYVTAYAKKVPNARPSMLLDHLDRRKSEIDVINGMVPVVAREAGTAAPYNEVVSAIIRARESEF